MRDSKHSSLRTHEDMCSYSPLRYVAECLKIMKNDGARLTKTRKAVVECLSLTKQPLSPQEIMKFVAESESSDVSVDLASVYRILKYLNKLGLVHQLGPTGGFFPCTHTKCGVGIHLLTHCGECDNTAELHLPEDMTSSLMSYLENQIEFNPEERVLEIKGVCKDCQVK
jgi:Fe2+ or Zn2+ uptake regulation protein